MNANACVCVLVSLCLPQNLNGQALHGVEGTNCGDGVQADKLNSNKATAAAASTAAALAESSSRRVAASEALN